MDEDTRELFLLMLNWAHWQKRLNLREFPDGMAEIREVRFEVEAFLVWVARTACAVMTELPQHADESAVRWIPHDTPIHE